MSPTAVFFLFCFASGCVLALVRHPIYGLMTYTAVFYVEPTAHWWGRGPLESVRWAFLAAAVTLLSVMFHRPVEKTAPLLRSGLFWGILAFLAWISLQSLWALDPVAHRELVTIWVKFVLVMFMICRCVDSEKHLRMFLWTHVAGCFYFGWLAFTTYSGGRFEGFGNSALAEANVGALQLVTGLVVAASLFLAGNRKVKAVLIGILPLVVNGIVATMSRSGFLAGAAAGLVYIAFTPKRFRGRVRILAVLGIALFALVTNEGYWMRIESIKYEGADIEGVDTGGGRLEIIQAQWRMFQQHPLGCGHMCTTFLSPGFLESRFLSLGARASHNTFMTMLVDHGIPGAIFYLAMLFWIFVSLRSVMRRVAGRESFAAMLLPAVAAALAAIMVGDLFVQYPQLEARVWFLSLLVVLLHVTASEPAVVPGRASAQDALTDRAAGRRVTSAR